jgi:hypothetical protein
MPDNTSLIDNDRTACLCDVGQDDYVAATAIAADGTEHLVLAEQASINDPTVVYDPTCSDVAHEQPGPLPLDVVKRITIAERTHRCGRRTKSGAPCRTSVTRAGDCCAWHRTRANA